MQFICDIHWFETILTELLAGIDKYIQWNPLINMSCLSDKKMLIAGRCYKASDNILY